MIAKTGVLPLNRRELLERGGAVSVGELFWLASHDAAAQPAPGGSLEVAVRPLPSPDAELDAVTRSLTSGPALRTAEARPNRRLISVREIDAEEQGKSVAARAAVAGRWRAVVYDCARQRTLVLEGRLGDTTPDRELVRDIQPNPSPSEWIEARDALLADRQLGPRLRAGELIAYRPMPPVLTGGEGGGRRLVTVGLLPRLAGHDATHEIVGVDLTGGPAQRFASRAPETSAAGFGPLCGAPAPFGTPSGQGVTGSYGVTIRRGTTTVWTFTVVRPSASSGYVGSGVELRDVVYRGRKVLHRAHVPILNVKYDQDACSPYRDWQYAESFLRAAGTNVAPGIRLASGEPRTIIQSGTDSGNFRGTAIWVHGEEITLRGELEAGWYRYISEWTLHTDGTIKPRFGFAAVQNSCVCNVHDHHAYWRLNFDIGGAGGDFVQRSSGAGWQLVPKETMAFRDAQYATRWRVGTRGSAAKYEIRPNATDGLARTSPDWPFPVGDLWFLRYRASEIDDGQVGVVGDVRAGLNRFVQNQSIDGVDVVVWYGAHFTHAQAGEEAGGHDHLVGPDLVPVGW
jgi:hypothetical protein